MASVARLDIAPGGDAEASRPGVWLTDLLLLLMAVIWGANFSVVKYGTQVLPPLAFNAVRITLAALVLLLLARHRGGQWPSRRMTLTLIGFGTVGMGLYQLLFVEGVARTRASDAALVIASSPILIALGGWMRGTEKLHARAWIGIALAVAGVAFVALGDPGNASGSSSLLGDFLVFLACVCWAWYAIAVKPLTHEVAGLPITALTTLGGALVLLVTGAPSIASADWAHLPLLGWGAILYAGLAALVVANLFWFRGMRVLGATRTAMYSNLQPVVALLVAWALLGEVPHLPQLVGVASITGGLFLTRQ
ncbi:MAG: DMT family transporter [Gemmatimonadaceae bacterium]